MIKLKHILNEAIKPKSIHVSYIERTGKLYSIKLDDKKIESKYIGDEFSVKIPEIYDEYVLNRLAKMFKQIFNIKFTYDDSMDVS